jgi:hypothetical protein
VLCTPSSQSVPALLLSLGQEMQIRFHCIERTSKKKKTVEERGRYDPISPSNRGSIFREEVRWMSE